VRSLVVLAVTAAAVLAAPSVALAQTDVMRMPQATSLLARPGQPDELFMGTSFGPLVSNDGGDTWRWICEDEVGYGGNYDPDYLYSPTGAVFATTFDGLMVMRDGCSFGPTALGLPTPTAIAQGSDGTIHVAMSFPGLPDPPLPADYKIYRSTNDGMSFDAGLEVGTGGEIWSTIEVAPSDPQRVYLTGFRIESGGARSHFLYRSIDGGDSYTALGIGDFTLTDQSELFVMAISQTDPQRVLLRVSRYRPDSLPGDEYFLSTNGGTSWTSVMQFTDSARTAVFLANGDAVIGSRTLGVYRSTTAGASFAMVAGAQPGIFCFLERTTKNELWACTDPLAPAPFDELVMKTPTLAQWTGVLRPADIDGPAECPTGTIQRDCCVDESAACPLANYSTWCRLRVSLQIIADPTFCAAPDAATGGDSGGPPPESCCDSSVGPSGPGILVLLVAFGLRRRRRASAL
jgi:hypothetical protein